MDGGVEESQTLMHTVLQRQSDVILAAALKFKSWERTCSRESFF